MASRSWCSPIICMPFQATRRLCLKSLRCLQHAAAYRRNILTFASGASISPCPTMRAQNWFSCAEFWRRSLTPVAIPWWPIVVTIAGFSRSCRTTSPEPQRCPVCCEKEVFTSSRADLAKSVFASPRNLPVQSARSWFSLVARPFHQSRIGGIGLPRMTVRTQKPGRSNGLGGFRGLEVKCLRFVLMQATPMRCDSPSTKR